MREVFIHIGLHKTGSTFLQRQVFPLLSDVRYFDRRWIHVQDGFSQLMFADESLYDETVMTRLLDDLEGDHWLFSTESFSGKPLFFHCVNRSQIANRLKSLFPEATILLFIRGQRSLMLSHYNQYVKGRNDGYRKMHEFFWYPEKARLDKEWFGIESSANAEYYNTSDFAIHLDVFRHYELISLYRSLFPRVEVFLYETLRDEPEKVMNRLSSIFHENLALSAADRLPQVNQSLGEKALQRKRRLNQVRFLTGNSWLTPVAKQVIGWLPFAGKADAHYQYADRLAKAFYKENNQKVIREFPEVGIQGYREAYPV